jgi:hypothetical protein
MCKIGKNVVGKMWGILKKTDLFIQRFKDASLEPLNS